MVTTNTDDLKSIQLNQQADEEEKGMDEMVINKNNYTKNVDLEKYK